MKFYNHTPGTAALEEILNEAASDITTLREFFFGEGTDEEFALDDGDEDWYIVAFDFTAQDKSSMVITYTQDDGHQVFFTNDAPKLFYAMLKDLEEAYGRPRQYEAAKDAAADAAFEKQRLEGRNYGA